MKVPSVQGNPELTIFMTEVMREMELIRNEKVSRLQGNSFFYMISPNGKAWKLSVDDAGVVTTVEIPSGGINPSG